MTEYNTLAEAVAANKIKTAVGKKLHKRTEGKAVEVLSPDQIAAKYNKRRRTGKTQRDHANGNPKRNAERKEARKSWQQDNRATNATFPV